MNWYGTNGSGSHAAAEPRADDTDAMCGNAVMYDATAGKILVIGGSIDYVCLPRCFGSQKTLAYMSTARRQRDGKCPYRHDRYPNDCSHRADDQLNVLSKNLRERSRTSKWNRKTLPCNYPLILPLIPLGLRHRWSNVRNPLLGQWQPTSTGNVGPSVHQFHKTRTSGHTPQLPLHRHPPPRRHGPFSRGRPVRSLRDEPLRRPDLQPQLPVQRQR